MTKKTLFAVGVIIGSVSFWGISCISRNPPAAATDTERSNSTNVAQAYQAPEVMEFVPGEWSKNSRVRKSLITDLDLQESAKRVRKMLILPDTMDYSLLDLSRSKIVFTPGKEHKLIFPTNSVLSVNEDTAKGTPIDAAVADSIFRADGKHEYKIMRARGLGIVYRGRARDVDYSLIGTVNLSPGVKSYIMSSNNMKIMSSTALYLVNCVDNRIISMLKIAEDWNDGLGAMMKQAYRIPAPAGSDIILTKMVSFPTDLEPFDDSDLSITYAAYKLNDSGELHRIYKPE